MYSPRISYPDGEVLQSFTAIGVVTSGHIYQVEMTPEFRPYRVDVKFLKCHEAPIRPLLDKLFQYHLAGFPSAELDHLQFLCTVDGTRAERELGFRPAFTLRETIRGVLGEVPPRVQALPEEPQPDSLGESRALGD